MNESPANLEHIDLSRHAVVEASAGTGKTHTIEQMVLRLLTHQGVSLQEILIVTFTEKATGELKDRLRRMLERESQKGDEFADVLDAAVDQFDQAPIFTIHGFCQRTLQEYALEQGQDFRAELVDDIDLLKVSLREIQRKHWRTSFGERLRDVLEKALYDRSTAEEWEKKVLAIATGYKSRCGHQLRPPFVENWWQRLDEVDANWLGQLEIFTIETLHRHLGEFKQQRGLQSFDDMIARVEESLDREKNTDAEHFLTVLRERYKYGIVDEFQDTDPLQWRIFRRIFLEGGESKLFVVGDPKQAIFAFRGADLPTYLQAAAEMESSHGARRYPLDVNWRSDPDLIDGLNCLFDEGEWFPKETGIQYVTVHPPDEDLRLSSVVDDRSNRPALTVVDLTHVDRLKLAHKHYAHFIAHEIQRLLAGGKDQPQLMLSLKKNPPRPLSAGDICILVAKRAEAEPIMHQLDLAGIPYSFYKQTGLWQSEEALHLEVLLQTLARPEDRSSFRKALLTCFFRVKPAELVQAPDVPTRHPARALFQSWLGFVESRQWSALFRSLLEDTGLLFDAADSSETTREDASRAERRLANLRQILATLEQVGHGSNFDLLALLEWMRQRRQQRDNRDQSFQPLEIGQPKVKIMTIHASKGLEFPLVFLGGGFTQGQAGRLPTVYRDDGGRIVFDLCPNADAAERVKSEQISEQRRLMYVALTRAMFKLYVPKVKVGARSWQTAGPVATILLPALERACPDKLGPLIAEVVVPPLAVHVPHLPKEEPEAMLPPASKPAIAIEGPLFPGVPANLSRRRIVVRSFSSMNRQHLFHVGEGSSFGDQSIFTSEEAPAVKTDHEDPLRGPVFGEMVHNVLEQIDFAEVARASSAEGLLKDGKPTRRLIDLEIKKNLGKLRSRAHLGVEELDQACRRQIVQHVWLSLRTPLQEIGGPLCDIPPADRLAEIEFVFPEQSAQALPRQDRLEESFVTGYMDLLFRKDGKYYLLDWKTNLLPGYGRDQMEHAMAESGYHRQYQLYLQAVSRWLRRVHGPKFSFFKQFGGVYYLFVRGLNGSDESSGVYFHRPTEKDLDLNHVLTMKPHHG